MKRPSRHDLQTARETQRGFGIQADEGLRYEPALQRRAGPTGLMTMRRRSVQPSQLRTESPVFCGQHNPIYSTASTAPCCAISGVGSWAGPVDTRKLNVWAVCLVLCLSGLCLSGLLTSRRDRTRIFRLRPFGTLRMLTPNAVSIFTHSNLIRITVTFRDWDALHSRCRKVSP